MSARVSSAAISPPLRKRTPHKRLRIYTTPNFATVDKHILAGSSVVSEWRKYSRASEAPVGYSAFASGYRQYRASVKALPEIAPGIPNYTPAENEAAERYWQDHTDPRSTILALTGFGCSLRVRYGMLESFDTGVTTTYERTDRRISMIVFGPFGGVLTTSAIEWCAAQGIGIVTLDYHGNMVSVVTAHTPALLSVRRAQFAADPLPIARAILLQKLAGCRRIGKQSPLAYARAIREIPTASTVGELLRIEATAALDYWLLWRFPMRYHPLGWPASWREFAMRGSVGNAGGPRHATHPVNCMLNYVYSIAAAQCVRACIAAGLDPSAGFLHADAADHARDAVGRYSLAYDVLELLRPSLDASLLPWIAAVRWRRADFPTTASGVVRVHPSLARVLIQRATSAVTLADAGRAVEWVVGAISGGMAPEVSSVTKQA